MSLRVLVAAAALGGALVGCGVSAGDQAGSGSTTTVAPSDAGGTGTGSSTTTSLADEPTGSDPASCEDAAAVSEAVGAEVDGFPTEGTGVSGDVEYSWSGCTYSSFDDDTVGFLDVERATAPNGSEQRLYELLDAEARTAALRDRFEPVDDLGEGAYLDGSTVVVKTGDVLVFADYEPEDPATTPTPTPALELARAALDLDLAVDAPPTCDEVEPLVADLLGDVDDSTTSSGFIGVNDVSITTAGCSVDLADGASAGIAVADAGPWEAWIAAKESFGLRASYEALDVDGRPAFDDGRRLVVDDLVAGDAHRPWAVDTGLWDGDPDEGAARRLAVARAVIDG